MIVRYNQLSSLDTPVLTLCNPGSVYRNGVLSNMVGVLTDTEAEEIIFNFNATSELNFRVNKVIREDPEENAYVQRMYQAVQNRRLVFVEDIGYFVISNIDDGFDGVKQYKDVKAKSIDAELSQKVIPYIEDGTYPFMTDATNQNRGIFEIIVESLPLWTIGEVDEAVATKWRTFTDLDTSINCLSFLLQNCQDAYECIFIFEPIHRTISVYSQDNYVRRTDVHITKHDLVNTLDITENADDLYTAISVMGDGDVTISAINPLGSNVLYNFDYYIPWMPEELGKKVAAWQDTVEAEKSNYYTQNLGYFRQFEASSTYQLQINQIDTQIKMYQRCRDNIVAESDTTFVDGYNEEIKENGGEEIVIYEQIEDTLANIDELIAGCEMDKANVQIYLDGANTKMEEYQAAIKEIQARVAIKQHFTEEEYATLCLYIYEGNYTDEYVILTESMTFEEKFEQMKILYDRAEAQLVKASSPTQEFNIDVENFLFSREFEQWSEQLETGCLINVELDIDDIAELFLSSMTVNYDDHKLSMTFGNRFNKFDPKSLFDDVLGNITKTANTLTYIKDILYPIKNGEFDSLKEALATSRSLTMGQALSSVNEEVIIDGSGYTGRKKLGDGTYDAHQIKITGKNIVFTNDSWDTCKVAIGSLVLGDGTSAYGINAETILGDMIIGGGLKIFDNNGNEILSVIDGIDTEVNGANGKFSKLSQKVDGFTLSVTNGEDSSTISLKSGDITLSSKEIKMTGVVSFADLSTKNSKTTIHGGNIQTGTITADHISSNFISALNLEVGKNVTMGPNAVISWDNITDKGDVATKTYVTSQGYETASSIKSTVITKDYIETLNIKAGSVDAENISGTTLTGKIISGGSISIGSQFSVSESGVVKCSGADIGGTVHLNTGSSIGNFETDSNSIFSGDWNSANNQTPNVFMCTGTSGSYTIGGSSKISGWVFGAGKSFGVTKDGVVYADKLNISGGDISIEIDQVHKVYGKIGYEGMGCYQPSTSCGLFIHEAGMHFKSNSYPEQIMYISDSQITSRLYKLLQGTWYVGSFGSTVQVTSDRNTKYDIQEQSDVYSQIFDQLKPITYKYKDGMSGRTHTGFIAQDVEDAVLSVGMDTCDFAAICYDIDESGDKVNYGIRYEEIVSLNTYEIQKLKLRLAELESKIQNIA